MHALSDISYMPARMPCLKFLEKGVVRTFHGGLPDDADMSLLKIFLVEDSPVIQSNLVAALEDLAPVKVVGISETANDACFQLLELHEQGGCDLVIVDVFLKAGSGLDVLRCLRDKEAPTLRVVLTNYATPEIRNECLSLGAKEVFDKSCDIDALVDFCNRIAPA